ncbi:hypothetical protein, partial [Lactococcus lactis]|uniref:hypothetical protein n=1 Tax=Lactococcus lactis TaxID=1358 RepID=UPI00223ADD1F
MASHAITIYFVTAFFTLHLIPHFTTLSKSSHAWYLPFIFTILKSSRLTDFLVNWSFSTVMYLSVTSITFKNFVSRKHILSPRLISFLLNILLPHIL